MLGGKRGRKNIDRNRGKKKWWETKEFGMR